MSWIEKYKWFERGIAMNGTSVQMQKFFQTKPTEEQLLILDDISRQEFVMSILLALVVFLEGVLFGAMLICFWRSGAF